MICRVCGSAMTLDALVAADAVRALDPGQPAPVVMKCRNGHAERLETGEPAPPPMARPTPRCAVCGVEIPRRPGEPPRKSCSLEHRRFIETKRAEALKLHRGDSSFRFVLEAQPWYRGAVTAFRQPAARLAARLVDDAPLFPEIPTAWLEGFRRLYPVLEEVPAALPWTFPPLEDPDESTALLFKTRRYRRRRRELTPEQRVPYPVHQA